MQRCGRFWGTSGHRAATAKVSFLTLSDRLPPPSRCNAACEARTPGRNPRYRPESRVLPLPNLEAVSFCKDQFRKQGRLSLRRLCVMCACGPTRPPHPCARGGSYRGKSGHTSLWPSRQKMTHSVISGRSIDAGRKNNFAVRELWNTWFVHSALIPAARITLQIDLTPP